MKYTIRHQPDVPGIESAHWMVWRPGAYQMTFGGFRVFARTQSHADAIRAVNADINRAVLEYMVETRQSAVRVTEAIAWWALRNAGKYKGPPFAG